MPNDVISWRIGGQAGEGIDSTGEIFAYSMARAGLNIYTFREFPSRIRGGYTGYEVRMSPTRRLQARSNSIDLLVAFDQETISANLRELSPGAAIIYDSSTFQPSLPEGLDLRPYGVPMAEIARDLGNVIMKNMVSLGVTAGLLGFSAEHLYKGISMRFGRKGKDVVEANRRAIERGLQHAASMDKEDGFELEVPADAEPKVLLSGNDAIGFGALVAGCRFYAGYPITPATEILEWLSPRLPKYGGVVIQAEDEIAAITSAIGAGYAGVRAMTATSGPGFSLMTEALSLAGMSEVPVVIVDAQRAGPSTGLPTKPEQSDIGHVLYGSHGDFPRIVLTPGSVVDCFYLTGEAFNLAEIYQCPVILLTDQSLSASKVSVRPEDVDPERIKVERGAILDEEQLKAILAGPVGTASNGGSMFTRYAITENGVSPRTLPGVRYGLYTANSNEHDETGHTTENPAMRVRMMEKRLRKLSSPTNGHSLNPGVEVHGPQDASVTVFGIGSVLGPVLEAMEALQREGKRVRYVQLKVLSPFPTRQLDELALDGKMLTVEHNATGQLARVLRSELGLSRDELKSLLKFNGTPFKPREVYEALKEMV
jgi:2-oxoglutarate ferredoxin oxidoreductase subunit alpha